MKIFKKVAALTIASAMLLTVAAGCGSKKDTKVLNVYNWGDYIDESVIKDFEKEYIIL